MAPPTEMLIVPEGDEQLEWLRVISAEAAAYRHDEQSVAMLGTATLETPRADREARPGPGSSPSPSSDHSASQGSVGSSSGVVATGVA